MKSTTDFEEWSNAVNPEGEEVESLFQSVKNPELDGLFKVEPLGKDGEQWTVTPRHVDFQLILVTPKARDAFLLHLEWRFRGGEDMEGTNSLI